MSQKKPMAFNTDTMPTRPPSQPGSGPLFDFIRYSEFKRMLGGLAATVDKNNIKVLAVLSEYPQEGKTFFVSAMALGYAILLGKRVLVVNTATHARPGSLSLQKVYAEQLGYVPMGDGHTQVTRMIDLISPRIPENGDMTPNPKDFQIGVSITPLRDVYDLILIDTCALSMSNMKNIDPVVISQQSDASILVTSDQALNQESMTKIKGLMNQWQLRLLGTVYNTTGLAK